MFNSFVQDLNLQPAYHKATLYHWASVPFMLMSEIYVHVLAWDLALKKIIFD